MKVINLTTSLTESKLITLEERLKQNHRSKKRKLIRIYSLKRNKYN